MTHDGRRWSNADEDRVDLVDYDPGWPARFAAEAARLRAALERAGWPSVPIEHFGSTAVPGLTAKPIIDIMLIVPDPSRWTGLVETITALDYVFWAENPRRDRLFFVKGVPPYGERRTHHVHVRTPEDARPAPRFRDHLRGHPEAAARYAMLKRELAGRFATDRDAYGLGKSRFVEEIVRAAEGADG